MDALIKKYRQQIVEIANNHGAKSVQLFGSFAMGNVTEYSDIDLLVEMETSRSLLDIIAIKNAVEDLTDRKVDVVTKNSLSPYIAEQVLRAARIL
jgi:predicted nucleotidyltransferase